MPNSDRIRSIWNDMKSRCYNSNVAIYPHYGGRGIEVCEEWKNSFREFEKWAVSNGYDDSLTIDRIDANKGYEPSNCRWATKQQQNRNKRNSIKVTIGDTTFDLADWADITGISYQTLYRRVVVYKWPKERYFEPLHKKMGKTQTIDFY